MKKTDKKIDNAIVGSLTEVCGLALEQVPGFKWITHLVDYRNYPDSVSIVCVFDTDEELAAAKHGRLDDYLRSLISEKMHAGGVQIKDVRQRITFDTEEACARMNAGKWHERLR